MIFPTWSDFSYIFNIYIRKDIYIFVKYKLCNIFLFTSAKYVFTIFTTGTSRSLRPNQKANENRNNGA
jgi:hypothetical protein